MRVESTFKNIIATLLTLITVNYFVSILFFTHFHVVDSHLVRHSHPFQNTEHHNADEILLLQSLSNINFIDLLSSVDLTPIRAILQELKATPIASTPISRVIDHYSLRAPPIMF
ncbi:MAG: hypothetical protein R3Y59_06105 [bacterium]